MEPFFSVILSSYNVEKYLTRCVESFLNQTFNDYELIIVDDGSTDKTHQIADEYAEKYKFISCIHKKNGGLSSARNEGIISSKGKYIHFCDADDWVEPFFLERLYEYINKYENNEIEIPDIVKFNFYRHMDEKDIYCNSIVKCGIYDSEEKIDSLLTMALTSMDTYLLSAWSHIYRREFLVHNNLSFVSERIVGSEDFLFNLQALSYSKSIYVIDDALYYYDLRLGSLTQKYRDRLPEQYVNLYKCYSTFISEKKMADNISDEFDNMFLWKLIFGTCFSNEYRITKDHTISEGRKKVRQICEIDEVQKIARKQLKKARKARKIIYLLAFIYKQEWLFYLILSKK